MGIKTSRPIYSYHSIAQPKELQYVFTSGSEIDCTKSLSTKRTYPSSLHTHKCTNRYGMRTRLHTYIQVYLHLRQYHVPKIKETATGRKMKSKERIQRASQTRSLRMSGVHEKKKQGLSSSGKKYEKRKGGLVGIVRWTGGEMKRIIPMGRASRDAGEACSP